MRVKLPLFVVAAALALLQPARSQDWPQRPVKIVVPYAPGGNTDGLGRIVAKRLSDSLGQQFVVENRPGAGGTIGAEVVARSPADGYTLMVAAVSVTAILPEMTKVAYDPVKDFAPISVIGTNPYVLLAHPSLPVDNLAQFVDYVRARPNTLSHAIAGLGGVGHLGMTLFLKRAGLDLIPVTYRAGGSAPLTDVLAGHVPIYFTGLSDVLPYAISPALKLLAVSSERRVPQLPNVPTFIESGFPGFKVLTWNGIMAPAGTSKAIINKIATEMGNAAKDPVFVERLAGFGVDPLGNSPEEFATMIATDIPFWADAVKAAGVQEK